MTGPRADAPSDEASDDDAARLLARAGELGLVVAPERVGPILSGARYLAEATRLLRAEPAEEPAPERP